MTRPKKNPHPGTSRAGANGDQVRQITPDDISTKPSRLSRRPKRSWRRQQAQIDRVYLDAIGKLMSGTSDRGSKA